MALLQKWAPLLPKYAKRRPGWFGLNRVVNPFRYRANCQGKRGDGLERHGDRVIYAYLLTIGAPLPRQPINHMVKGQVVLKGEGDTLKP